MSMLATLRAKGCRVDGVLINTDGTIGFATTNAGGAWTDDQKSAVLLALGKQAPALTQAQLQAHYTAVAQNWLDTTARQYNYDNIVTAVTYIDSSNTTWAAQSKAFRTWRDQVWQDCYALLAQVQAGTTPLPTSDQDFLSKLTQPSIPQS